MASRCRGASSRVLSGLQAPRGATPVLAQNNKVAPGPLEDASMCVTGVASFLCANRMHPPPVAGEPLRSACGPQRRPPRRAPVRWVAYPDFAGAPLGARPARMKACSCRLGGVVFISSCLLLRRGRARAEYGSAGHARGDEPGPAERRSESLAKGPPNEHS